MGLKGKRPDYEALFSGGEGGIRILSPQWGRENLNKENAPTMRRFFSGGEGGIRTREPLWVTRFPSVRAKPDYATSPSSSWRIIPLVIYMTIRDTEFFSMV